LLKVIVGLDDVEVCNTSDRKLKAGFSIDADAASSGRTVEPVVFTLGLPGICRSAGVEGFPRVESIEGSSLFFIVRSFVLSLESTAHYYDLC